jgi:MFS family permease
LYASVTTAQIRPGKFENCVVIRPPFLYRNGVKLCKKTVKDDSRIPRKITATLFAAQSLVSAAFVVSGTVSAIVGAQLSDNPAWAGVPWAVQRLGMAFAALAVGATMDRIGRRWGLALGLAVGTLGAGLAAEAIGAGTFLLFLGGSVLMGVASAAMQLGRFAAAEVHPPESRGRAISSVVVGGTVGSVLGGLLVGPSGRWAQQSGRNELVGPYLATLVILALASLAIFVWLRPDPRDVGRKMAETYPETVVHSGPTRSISQILRTPAAFVALSAMVFGQVVMVMLMGMASLHMVNYQHTLTDISVVFSAHTFGMFAFSMVAGRLTDRWGRGPVILSGTAMLVLACALAPLSPDVLPLSIALFLLGVGWNFCYVGGSALLSDQLSPQERAKTQGANDFLIGLATAAASFGSGLMFAGTSYIVIGIVGAVVSLVPMGLTGWWMARKRRLAVVWGSKIRGFFAFLT